MVFTAIPDLYDGKGALRCIKGTFAQMSAQRGPMFDRLDATPNVVKLRSPYTQNTISRDGHSALVSFEIPGTFDTVASKVAPLHAATAAAQRPALTESREPRRSAGPAGCPCG